MPLSPDDLAAAEAIAAALSPLSEQARDQLALLLRPAVLAVQRQRAEQRRVTRQKRAPGGAEATA